MLQLMDADKMVGQKIVALRNTRGIGQKELLTQLSAYGVDWSQTILSKVENGSRPIRFVEALALADALGVMVSELRPAGGALERRKQRAGWVLKQAADALHMATWEMNDATSRAHAVELAYELSNGKTGPYIVRGTAKTFIRSVTTDIDDEQSTDIDEAGLLTLIGVPKARIDAALAEIESQIAGYIERGYQDAPAEWAGTDSAWMVRATNNDAGEDFDLAGYIAVFTRLLFDELRAEALVVDALPFVTFQPSDDPDANFTVEGIHNPLDDIEAPSA